MFHYVSKWSSDDTTIFKQGITRRTPVNRAKEQAYPIKCYGLGVYDVELVSCVHIYTESHAELIESVWKREFKCGIDYALMPDGRTEAWISQDVDADIEKIKTDVLWFIHRNSVEITAAFVYGFRHHPIKTAALFKAWHLGDYSDVNVDVQGAINRLYHTNDFGNGNARASARGKRCLDRLLWILEGNVLK